MRKAGLILVSVLGLAIATPASADAQTVNAPSGNSGISQYLEVVPDSTGNRKSTGGPNRSVLSERVEQVLRGSGQTGHSLSQFVSRTSPPKRGLGTIPIADGQDLKSALAATVAGSDASTGMGLFLPVLMALAALFALLAGARRRHPGPDGG